jgi:hypothetical protein
MPSTSCSSHKKPALPSSTTSPMPLCRVAATGRPLAIASSTPTGVPSQSPFDASTECWA